MIPQLGELEQLILPILQAILSAGQGGMGVAAPSLANLPRPEPMTPVPAAQQMMHPEPVENRPAVRHFRDQAKQANQKDDDQATHERKRP